MRLSLRPASRWRRVRPRAHCMLGRRQDSVSLPIAAPQQQRHTLCEAAEPGPSSSACTDPPGRAELHSQNARSLDPVCRKAATQGRNCSAPAGPAGSGLDLNPQDPLAHYNYGLASLLSGKLDQAIAHFESAVQLAPADPYTHYYLGRARLLRKEYAAAVAELQSAVKLNPADARAYNALGVALAANGKPDAAKDALEKALELDPSSPLFRKNTQCLREGCALEP